MEVKIDLVKEVIVWINQGVIRRRVIKTATILGIKVRVCSLI